MPTISWNWGEVSTNKSDRSLQNGQLVRLTNLRRTVEGRLQKRPGWDKTSVTTFVGGTFAGPCTEMIPQDSVIFRDTSNQLWSKDATDGKAYYRGTSQRCSPSVQYVDDISNSDGGLTGGVVRPDHQGGSHKPISCVTASGDMWTFALGAMDSGVECYQVTVTDKLTGAIRKPTTFRSSLGIVAYACFADSNDNVVLLWVANDTGIYRHIWSGTTRLLLTNNTYATQAGAKFSSIDAKRMTTSGTSIICAATSWDETFASPVSGIFRSFATTSAGTPTTSFSTTTLAFQNANTTGVSILEWDQSDNFWHIAFWKDSASVLGDSLLTLQKISTSNPATVTTTTLATVSDPTASGIIGTVSGFVDLVTGNRKILATRTKLDDYGPGGQLIERAKNVVTKYEWDGATTATTVVAHSAWLASKPWRIGSKWYFLTGFDDGSQLIQNGYFVRDENGAILSSVLDGEGWGEYFAPVVHSLGGTYQLLTLMDSHVVSAVSISATKVALPLLGRGISGGKPTRAVVTIDHAATYFSTSPGVVPGGVPCFVGPRDSLSEITPIHAPYEPFSVNGNGSSALVCTNYITYLYKVVDSDGNVNRSAPFPVPPATVFKTGGSGIFTLTIPTLRHVISTTSVYIEVYGSVDGGTEMFLQHSLINDPTVDTVTTSRLLPQNWDASGELLYTTGKVLVNVSLDPARLSTTWRNRTFFWGTPDGSIIPSVEHVPGHGPEYKSALPFTWESGDTDGAMCELSYDALVLFRRNSIGLVTGAGPDSRGVGGYRVQTLETEKGCTNPSSVVVGPIGPTGASGVYFQAWADGRINVVSGGVVYEVGQGQEAYRGYVVSGSLHDVAAGEILFTCTNGKTLVVDYRHPANEQTYGQMSERGSAALPAFLGVQAISGAPVALEAGTSSVARTWSPGATFLDDGTQVLTSLKTGRMQPAGLLGEFDCDESVISMEQRGGSSTYSVTLTDSQGNTDVHQISASSLPDAFFRAAVYRTRDVQIEIQELSATGEGHSFDGMSMNVLPYGEMRLPALAKWLP